MSRLIYLLLLSLKKKDCRERSANGKTGYLRHSMAEDNEALRCERSMNRHEGDMEIDAPNSEFPRQLRECKNYQRAWERSIVRVVKRDANNRLPKETMDIYQSGDCISHASQKLQERRNVF